ncbi:MAG: hypothetical protein JWL75_747 [Parcubacteria group bacterium]|nr:hypothetical protein [Parcubacteria group bacterium]
MRTDLWFYFFLIVFFFVAWVYSGGPTHPISFAGPYITPITNVGQTSDGYGDPITKGNVSSSFTNWVGSGSNTSSGSNSTKNVVTDAKSSYVGTVHFGNSNTQGRTSSDEYVTVVNGGNSNVAVSGWQIVDGANKNSIRIQNGYRDLQSGTVPVTLSSGQGVTIFTGSRNVANTNSAYYANWLVFLDQNHDLWNDSNDTLTLLDSNGKVVDQYHY